MVVPDAREPSRPPREHRTGRSGATSKIRVWVGIDCRKYSVCATTEHPAARTKKVKASSAMAGALTRPSCMSMYRRASPCAKEGALSSESDVPSLGAEAATVATSSPCMLPAIISEAGKPARVRSALVPVAHWPVQGMHATARGSCRRPARRVGHADLQEPAVRPRASGAEIRFLACACSRRTPYGPAGPAQRATPDLGSDRRRAAVAQPLLSHAGGRPELGSSP